MLNNKHNSKSAQSQYLERFRSCFSSAHGAKSIEVLSGSLSSPWLLVCVKHKADTLVNKNKSQSCWMTITISPCLHKNWTATRYKIYMQNLKVEFYIMYTIQTYMVPYCVLYTWYVRQESWGFPGGASGKEPACQCKDGRDLGSIPGLTQEEEIATHSSILAWRISWTEEPGRL